MNLACPKCFTEIPRDAPEGICPKCLMGLGFTREVDSFDEKHRSVARPAIVPPKPEELAEHFSDFEILELLGHGGMGAVYKARHIRHDRIVTLTGTNQATGTPHYITPEQTDCPNETDRRQKFSRQWLKYVALAGLVIAIGTITIFQIPSQASRQSQPPDSKVGEEVVIEIYLRRMSVLLKTWSRSKAICESLNRCRVNQALRIQMILSNCSSMKPAV